MRTLDNQQVAKILLCVKVISNLAEPFQNDSEYF